jgi:hypothetical protein
MKNLLLLIIVLFITSSVSAQQVAVLKKGHIAYRYYQGDEIRYILKGDKQEHHAAILSIHEFDFVTLQRDTVKFMDVAKLKFKNGIPWTYVKSTLIGSAALLALHFALKPAFGDKNPQSINGLSYAAGAGAISLVFVFATSRSHMKLNGIKRLKFINYDSPLYR